MIVSPQQPFRIVYSIYEHPYMGHIIEPFVVQLSDKQQFTYSHQKISSSNAEEFASGLKEKDYELIALMDEIRIERIIKYYNTEKLPIKDNLNKIFDKNANFKLKILKDEIISYVGIRRKKILKLFSDELFYKMDAHGEPVGKQLFKLKNPSRIVFYFHKNEDNTHYYPQIISNNRKISLHKQEVSILCNNPAWVVINDELHHFDGNIEGKKLQPFLRKKFVLIPQKLEKMYYEKYISKVIEDFDVRIFGFDIVDVKHELKVRLRSTYIPNVIDKDLFEKKNYLEEEKIHFECEFVYNNIVFSKSKKNVKNIQFKIENDKYLFYKIIRKTPVEEEKIKFLADIGLDLCEKAIKWPLLKGLLWIQKKKKLLATNKIELIEDEYIVNNYASEIPQIKINIYEKIDWFDLKTEVQIGDYTFNFSQLKSIFSKRKNFIELPNGRKAIVPNDWYETYEELFTFAENGEQSDVGQLKKYHLGLINRLYEIESNKTNGESTLSKLKKFQKIEEYPLPKGFNGELRNYQKAGYDWLNFLNNYGVGGCLADDMGLGKTIQTLALIQSQKEQNKNASLLIVPTSLIYNWMREASLFTPNLLIFSYIGQFRAKSIENFKKYNLIITSYGVMRRDVELLSKYYYNYIILDESQAIKNPNSSTTKKVKLLSSRQKLCITGTPLENTTMDLWSQMDFLNNGLLGSISYFKKNFQTPIEKKGSHLKAEKFSAIIKPFLLRRNKSQVLSELPDKIENLQYVDMSEAQSNYYEEKKEECKQVILNEMKQHGFNYSRFKVLQGLTKLRLIANHPQMADESYEGDSGKFEVAMEMMKTIVSEGNKMLVFSQFTKHLSLFRKKLNQENITFCYLDGRTKDRQEQVDIFQNDDSIKVFLISLKAGGVGLNLTKAEYVFILDPWWNPAIEAQAIDRTHRIGQKNNVMSYKFITKNTVEEKILLLQQKKKDLSEQLIFTEQSFIKKLSETDIELLFD